MLERLSCYCILGKFKISIVEGVKILIVQPSVKTVASNFCAASLNLFIKNIYLLRDFSASTSRIFSTAVIFSFVSDE